jgi:hypothetical protein
MREPVKVYCSCGRRVGTWDGKSTINVICKCKHCEKRVVYHVDNGVTEIKDVPPRQSSSGMNFSY